jgi:hypothetical protein
MSEHMTQRDFQSVTCAAPGCDHTAHDDLYLHSACHPHSATWSVYSAKSGDLTVECAQCGQTIAVIAVAP